jgi:hypothetical protein
MHLRQHATKKARGWGGARKKEGKKGGMVGERVS